MNIIAIDSNFDKSKVNRILKNQFRTVSNTFRNKIRIDHKLSNIHNQLINYINDLLRHLKKDNYILISFINNKINNYLNYSIDVIKDVQDSNSKIMILDLYKMYICKINSIIVDMKNTIAGQNKL